MRHLFSLPATRVSRVAGLMLWSAGLILQAPLELHADTLLKMTAPRLYPQVTLLGDGTVLIAGGWGGTAALRSAERFDPRTGLFTALPPMAVARDDSGRALRLPDGRVLITSGTDSRRADLFDPATNTFSQPGNMVSGRGGDTQTLLPDGRVLLAGGWNSNGRWETAEIFDPTQNQFAATDSMSWGRYRHTAVALPDGRTAVLGGLDNGNLPVTSVEIYDPKNNRFHFAGEMTAPRFDHQSVLLRDGRILTVGGRYVDDQGGAWHRNSGETFDPSTGTASPVEALQNLPIDPAVVLLADGRVLVAGGFILGPELTEASFSRTALAFDPASGKATPTAPLTLGRAAANASLLPDGRVLIVGGAVWDSASKREVVTDTAEFYTP